LFGSIIGNPKYLDGPRGHGGLGGFEPPPLGSNGYLVKIMSTSLGTLTSVSLEV